MDETKQKQTTTDNKDDDKENDDDDDSDNTNREKQIAAPIPLSRKIWRGSPSRNSKNRSADLPHENPENAQRFKVWLK